jgi:hypothetical protein
VRWAREDAPSRAAVLDALLVAVLGAEGRPSWLAAEAVALVARLVAPLAAPRATVEDALRVARMLAAAFTAPALALPATGGEPDLLLDDLTGGDPLDPWGDETAGVPTGAPADAETPPADAVPIELAPEADERRLGGQPLGAEELRRLLEMGVRIGQGHGDVGAGGIPITALLGKIPREALEALRRLLEAAPPDAPRRAGRGQDTDDRAFFYDEWDHVIGDYRPRWCRLHERALTGDSGEFFGRALADYAAVLPEVRRQFQRIRPEMYRPLRGLEDGEDFDLNAVTDARIEVRARRSPSTRLYKSRVREARDVATLFLLDMSASTDEPLGPGRRIIDALKEALVVMTEALDELGDAYAIYGFSGQGRENVEFYLVKGFGEALGTAVKSRIGGIVPKRSTRMGAALRHAVEKMDAVGARVKHLMLLSDGFPQDDDYGEDRRSHLYGIRDTAVALREADAAGITPFCITVDRAGHDYLREMCDASRYMVIDDITALPRDCRRSIGGWCAREDRHGRGAASRRDEEVPARLRRARGRGLPPELRRRAARLREPVPPRADGPRLGREPVLHRGRPLRAVRDARRVLPAGDGRVHRRPAVRAVALPHPAAGRGGRDRGGVPGATSGRLAAVTWSGRALSPESWRIKS